jgi:nucleoside-diphosphate-sugar epimerase
MTPAPLALVTGYPGWLGNRLLHYLRHPHPDLPSDVPARQFERIRCLVLPGTSPELAEPDVELVEGDLRDPEAARRFCSGAEGAVLFHLAGIIHPARRVRELYEVNVEGSRALIEAAASSGVRRIVATSSNSPAGVSRDPSTLFDERSPYRPYLAYGRSKKAMEDDLNAANARGDLEAVILRPTWFYGPDQPPRQTTFFTMIKDGKAPIVGGGDSRRSMSYVDNTALGLLLAAVRDAAAGETYWIADERPYTMNEIVDTVEELLESEFGMEVAHDRMRLPSAASGAAYVLDAGLQRVGLYHQKLHVLGEMNKTIACRIDKARDELGYRPSVELREGMRRSIEWCLANGQRI